MKRLIFGLALLPGAASAQMLENATCSEWHTVLSGSFDISDPIQAARMGALGGITQGFAMALGYEDEAERIQQLVMTTCMFDKDLSLKVALTKAIATIRDDSN